VGITKHGKLLLVTVSGDRAQDGTGVSLEEMGLLLKQLGAIDAMNLDGGGSSQMVVEGEQVNGNTKINGKTPWIRPVSACLMIRPVPVQNQVSNSSPSLNVILGNSGMSVTK
jgi:exopolysaccharide biosynthesis protein